MVMQHNETDELYALCLSHLHTNLQRQLTEVRKDGTLPYLRADGKSQVTVEYDDNKIVGIDTVVISTQHDEDVTLEQIRRRPYRDMLSNRLSLLSL